ncbi:MAG: hypothetical protein SNG02_06505 [Rikenellaceae bacterium]
MNLLRNISVLLLLVGVVSCHELPRIMGGDKIVASVGDRELRMSDLSGVVPSGLSPEDSISFVARYAQRWILSSVKLVEAEQVFASSAPDIDKMVEEYRNSLMIKRLEKYKINQDYNITESAEDIKAYYRDNSDKFLLTKELVKGRILSFPKETKDGAALLKSMSELTPKGVEDFRSTCEKRGFSYTELTSGWIEYADFLDRLPIVRDGAHYANFISKSGVQQLEDEDNKYYFQITEVKEVGEIEPLERIEETIRYILSNKNQAEFLQLYEAELLKNAQQKRGFIRNYISEEVEPTKEDMES